MAKNRIQKANGERASAEPMGVRNSVRANTPIMQTTTAVIAIITTDSPSARSAMPSGGGHSPSK
jgi:hypothetical protein